VEKEAPPFPRSTLAFVLTPRLLKGQQAWSRVFFGERRLRRDTRAPEMQLRIRATAESFLNKGQAR